MPDPLNTFDESISELERLMEKEKSLESQKQEMLQTLEVGFNIGYCLSTSKFFGAEPQVEMYKHAYNRIQRLISDERG
ncbi:MAG: hypothetical protein ABIH59_02040 [archaeon]